MTIKYTKWQENRPNGQIHPNLSLQDIPKFTQVGIFGSKIYHLATLVDFSSWKRIAQQQRNDQYRAFQPG
jgi:hypothetical protein